MPDNTSQTDQQEPVNYQSTEDMVAAQAGHEADALSRVQAELAELKAKSAELADQFLRAKAEAENARRRAEEEISKARKFAVDSFAESLLPVADSLEAGLTIKDATPEQIREGAQATLRQLTAVLERNKVIAINPAAGTKFDPHQHQAISMVPLPADSAQEANTVVSVLQKGYSIAERVLRPALVTVAAPKGG
jgi:molecular chaperone GrpE